MEEMKEEFRILGRAFSKFNQVSKKAMDFGVGIPIYPSEIHTVERLCENGPMSVTELAGITGVTKAAMSQLVTKLIKKGLAYRETDPENNSRHRIMPTALGKTAQANHMRFHMEHDRKILSHIAALPDEHYEVFKEICTQLDLWMDSYLE